MRAQTNSTTTATASNLNSTTTAELAGAVTIEVKDLSSDGLISTFEMKFKLIEHEIEQQANSTETEAT